MCVSRLLAAAVLLLSFMYSFPDQADARPWRETPSDKATQYTQIIDQRSDEELVLVWWLVPEIIEPTPENELFRSMVQEYLVVFVVHADISPFGEFTFRTPTDVVVQTSEEEVRRPLVKDALPPLMIGSLSMFQLMFSRAMGRLGQGMHPYTFDGKGIESCQKGAFWVVYAGEKYLYETPIPGCP